VGRPAAAEEGGVPFPRQGVRHNLLGTWWALVADWEPYWDLYPSCLPFAFDEVGVAAVAVLINEAAGVAGEVRLHSEAGALAAVVAAVSAVADIDALAPEQTVVLQPDVAEEP